MRLKRKSIYPVVFFMLCAVSINNSESRTHFENQIIKKEIKELEIKIQSLLNKGKHKKAIQVLKRASSITSSRQLSLKFKLANLYFQKSHFQSLFQN